MKSCHAILTTAFLALAATGVSAADYRAAAFQPAKDIFTENAFDYWSKEVKKATNGDIAFRVFAGGSLIPAKSAVQGVADGLAQVGNPAAGYTPTLLPISNALSGMGFVNTDAYVLAFAYADFSMNEPVGYNDWRHNGVIPSGGFSTPAYYLICRGDGIRTAKDLQGKRVRMPGGLISNFAQATGMTSVNIPTVEAYQAFEHGAIDCTANDPTFLTGATHFAEVANSVTTLPLTPAFNATLHMYNVDFWKGLTATQRRTLLDMDADTMAHLQINWDKQAAQAMKDAQKEGVEVIKPDASLQHVLDNWVADGVGDMAGVARSSYGVQNPDALFATFKKYMDKWQRLVSGLKDRHDQQEVTALLKANLFDAIDVKTYGID